jgi:hypothetical protein
MFIRNQPGSGAQPAHWDADYVLEIIKYFSDCLPTLVETTQSVEARKALTLESALEAVSRWEDNDWYAGDAWGPLEEDGALTTAGERLVNAVYILQLTREELVDAALDLAAHFFSSSALYYRHCIIPKYCVQTCLAAMRSY